MDPITILAERFTKFPGIGPRQAGRFVHFLLRSSATYRRELAQAILALSATRRCNTCMRYHTGEDSRCAICSHPNRDETLLAIVANDTDLDALEKSGAYKGVYFVIGGTISLATERASLLREKELLARIGQSATMSEIILAFPANPEGDFTASQLRSIIAEHYPNARITVLGRGLSTGSELEYADPDTLKSALSNRH